MASATTKFAMRSMWRNPRRTILAAAGIAVGVMISIVLSGFMEGGMAQFFDVIAFTGVGHVRVVPSAWVQRHDDDLRLARWEEYLAKAKSIDVVLAATPRARTTGLLAMGNRIVGVPLTGVDPETEPSVCHFVKPENISAGAYLEKGDEGVIVLGAAICDRLDAEVDDELFATVADEGGEMRSSMLRVKGIVSTDNDELDLSIAHVMLGDVHRLTDIPGAGEVSIVLRDGKRDREVVAQLEEGATADEAVLVWTQVMPSMGAVMGAKTGYNSAIIGMCVFVVMLGIVSSQITAVLERRREFGMLAALGMNGRQVVRILAIEAVILGVAGALVGLVLGMPLLYLMATEGVDIGWIYGEADIIFAGIRMQTIWYADMGLWVIHTALAVGLGSTFLATLYPAWLVHRLKPADAMRVAN